MFVVVLPLKFIFILNASPYGIMLVSQFNWNAMVTFIWNALNFLWFLESLFALIPIKIIYKLSAAY